MTEVCSRYGGLDFFNEYVTDISKYWRYVVIESPVYYISYAVSGISAMTLYSQACNDYQGAIEIYRQLTEEIADPHSFLETLQQAGLATPFEEAAYIEISELLK